MAGHARAGHAAFRRGWQLAVDPLTGAVSPPLAFLPSSQCPLALLRWRNGLLACDRRSAWVGAWWSLPAAAGAGVQRGGRGPARPPFLGFQRGLACFGGRSCAPVLERARCNSVWPSVRFCSVPCAMWCERLCRGGWVVGTRVLEGGERRKKVLQALSGALDGEL